MRYSMWPNYPLGYITLLAILLNKYINISQLKEFLDLCKSLIIISHILQVLFTDNIAQLKHVKITH